MAGAGTRRNPPSIRMVWAIAKSPELGLTDEDLYGVVYQRTGKDSLRALSPRELGEVVRVLQDMKDGISRRNGRRRTDEGGNARTVELRRKAYRVMEEMGWDEARVNGLARRMFGAERIEWLNPEQCGKLIEALKAIQRRQADPGKAERRTTHG